MSERTFCDIATDSCLVSEESFCKFLTANDSVANKSHQAGILVSTTATRMIFGKSQMVILQPKKTVKISWNNEIKTESMFTWYPSKNEIRITVFGKSFPYRTPEQTGSLFVLTKQDNENYSAFFLDSESDIEKFLDNLNICPTETNKPIDCNGYKDTNTRIKEYIKKTNSSFSSVIPPSDVMASLAEDIENKLFGHKENVITNPD